MSLSPLMLTFVSTTVWGAGVAERRPQREGRGCWQVDDDAYCTCRCRSRCRCRCHCHEIIKANLHFRQCARAGDPQQHNKQSSPRCSTRAGTTTGRIHRLTHSHTHTFVFTAKARANVNNREPRTTTPVSRQTMRGKKHTHSNYIYGYTYAYLHTCIHALHVYIYRYIYIIWNIANNGSEWQRHAQGRTTQPRCCVKHT